VVLPTGFAAADVDCPVVGFLSFEHDDGEVPMPTGAKHYRVYEANTAREWTEECRCTLGEDHDDEGNATSNYLGEDEAEDIWRSSGMDPDYDFRSGSTG